MRLLAVVEYDGTDFAGFQLQRRPATPADQQPRTVQTELERAIAAATGTFSRVIGSGRTDSGVHAAGQVVHFDSEAPLARTPPRLLAALNAHLPPDLAIVDLRAVALRTHARFSATSRTYRYRIANRFAPSPLLRRYAHHVRKPLDVARMQQAGQALVGVHDFVAFAAQQGVGSTTREVRRVQVSHTWANPLPIWHTSIGRRFAPPFEDGAADPSAARLVEIEVEANAFLRHMMRRIAGTLIRVGDGRLAPEQVGQILASRDKALAGPTAPACGLCLERVSFPPHLDPAQT